MSFIERLKSLRNEQGISQKELADSVGLTDRTIRRYESGEIDDPTLSTLNLLADYFNVSLDYLTGRSTKK